MPHESNSAIPHTSSAHPSLLAIASFFVRSKGLQAKCAAENLFRQGPPLEPGSPADFPFLLAESISPLLTTADPRERPLLLGKIHNLRLASRNIHRRVLLPGQIFSFWRQVGGPWKSRGFEMGREVREGCVIPTSGGGVCQLSGSLLEVALLVGFEIVERHGHTALPPDVSGESRRDATVFWNYVDLRFRSSSPVLLESIVTQDALVVRVRGKSPKAKISQSPQLVAITKAQSVATSNQHSLQSCFVCDETDCVRHQAIPLHKELIDSAKSTFLLDEFQPEFNAYLQQHKKPDDAALFPFRTDSTWQTEGFSSVRSFPLFRFQRSWTLRRAVSRGMTVAKAHFDLSQSLARRYEKHLAYDVEHLCVAQSLLPHLWGSGALGGRSFDVLMSRFPATVLEKLLDEAARLYASSKTLTEFRAPRWFVEAEQEALRSARRIITPHTQIADCFENSLRLPWTEPQPQDQNAGASQNDERDLIVFLGPTLARKGAYAVREAIRKTGLSLLVPISDLEEPGFWGNLPVIRTDMRKLPWHKVHTVLQPALFEYWPRQLLRAHAAHCNLVVTPNCGIPAAPDAGIHHVPFGDSNALISTLETPELKFIFPTRRLVFR